MNYKKLVEFANNGILSIFFGFIGILLLNQNIKEILGITCIVIFYDICKKNNSNL